MKNIDLSPDGRPPAAPGAGDRKHRDADEAKGGLAMGVLTLLKRRGPQTVADLAQAFALTGEAMRQRLLKLAGEGLVEARSDPGSGQESAGRPAQRWRLTGAGHARFPDRHAELTAQLLRTIRDTLGEAVLARLVDARRQEAEANYAAALAETANLEERVARLAEIRGQEGYMAEWREEADGSYLLIENHCPICVAATECIGFCAAELAAFRQGLGSVGEVERVEHLLAGGRRCVYRVTPSGPSSAAERRAADPI